MLKRATVASVFSLIAATALATPTSAATFTPDSPSFLTITGTLLIEQTTPVECGVNLNGYVVTGGSYIYVTSGSFTPGVCVAEGNSCTDSAQCCQSPKSLECIQGVCIEPQPAPYYAPASFTREYEGTCAQGSRVVWRTFSWKGKTPGDSSITVAVRTADPGGPVSMYCGVKQTWLSGSARGICSYMGWARSTHSPVPADRPTGALTSPAPAASTPYRPASR